ncbi:MAG: hypothetical protein FD175_786 [Beijerinckiaceae bacterium]|nr:MAG: hypothetical protein FD175_786 [Beijerinckiaceae bacterium]
MKRQAAKLCPKFKELPAADPCLFQPLPRAEYPSNPCLKLFLFEKRLPALEQRFETFKPLLASVDGKIKRN